MDQKPPEPTPIPAPETSTPVSTPLPETPIANPSADISPSPIGSQMSSPETPLITQTPTPSVEVPSISPKPSVSSLERFPYSVAGPVTQPGSGDASIGMRGRFGAFVSRLGGGQQAPESQPTPVISATQTPDSTIAQSQPSDLPPSIASNLPSEPTATPAPEVTPTPSETIPGLSEQQKAEAIAKIMSTNAMRFQASGQPHIADVTGIKTDPNGSRIAYVLEELRGGEKVPGVYYLDLPKLPNPKWMQQPQPQS